MNRKLFSLLSAAVWLLCASGSLAAESNTNTVMAELQAIIQRINTKLEARQATEADLAENLRELDLLAGKYKGEKSREVAQISMAKMQLYLQVLNQPEQALKVLQRFKRDFPETQIGGNTDEVIQTLERMIAKKRLQDSLVVGAVFPDFKATDLAGKPLSLANYQGKVVLVDFWATWCMPCLMELPHVLKAYEKYHKEGFEIIGVSLDENKERLESFIKSRNMPWPQYFDGKRFENKLADKYGVDSIPATYLIGPDGKIIARDLRGEELEAAVQKALAKK